MTADNNGIIVNAGNTATANQVLKNVIRLGRNGIWVGDEVALAAASYLVCNIHIYFASGKIEGHQAYKAICRSVKRAIYENITKRQCFSYYLFSNFSYNKFF